MSRRTVTEQDVLELARRAPGTWTAATIAAHIGVPQSTVQRRIAVLRASGLLMPAYCDLAVLVIPAEPPRSPNRRISHSVARRMWGRAVSRGGPCHLEDVAGPYTRHTAAYVVAHWRRLGLVSARGSLWPAHSVYRAVPSGAATPSASSSSPARDHGGRGSDFGGAR